jgi:phage terminase large subunit-like protein
MTKENIQDLRTKILQGISLAYQRLLIARQKEDGELVISRNGKVVKVKARELPNT